MSKQGQDDWVSPTVTITICLLAALVSPFISLPTALVAMVGMAFYYRHRYQTRVGAVCCLVGAAVIAVAIAYLLVQKSSH